MGIPYLNNSINRLIEIFILLFFTMALIYYTKVKLKYRSISSKIRICIIFLCFAVCFLDNLLALINNNFPMFNFIFRGILIILLSRKLREEWRKIILVIYFTRSIFFILFFCVIVFALLGHQLFIGEFSHIYTSIDAMFVIITTSNFPDIMLKNMVVSKFSIFFFIGYLLITYFIIISLLKALYYSNYLEIKKYSAKDFLSILKSQEISYDEKKILKYHLNTLAKTYSLSKDEIEKFKEAMGVNNTEFNSINVRESTIFLQEDIEEINIK